MAKTGPLSKADKYYIEQHWTKEDFKTIAEDLDRSNRSIEEYIEEVKIMKTKAGGQFARHGDPERGGAVVATEAATMMGDDFKKRSGATRRQQRCTTKTKD